MQNQEKWPEPHTHPKIEKKRLNAGITKQSAELLVLLTIRGEHFSLKHILHYLKHSNETPVTVN